jgi:hypothetical protein
MWNGECWSKSGFSLDLLLLEEEGTGLCMLEDYEIEYETQGI